MTASDQVQEPMWPDTRAPRPPLSRRRLLLVLAVVIVVVAAAACLFVFVQRGPGSGDPHGRILRALTVPV